MDFHLISPVFEIVSQEGSAEPSANFAVYVKHIKLGSLSVKVPTGIWYKKFPCPSSSCIFDFIC